MAKDHYALKQLSQSSTKEIEMYKGENLYNRNNQKSMKMFNLIPQIHK